MSSRREFLKKCGGTLAAVASPVLLTRCAAGAPTVRGAFDGEQIVLAKSELASQLRADGFLMVQAQNLPIRIVLRRVAGKGYIALSTVCTHSGCEVRPLPSSFQCPCHGSEYDLFGEVREGPAREPLQQFQVIENENDLTIKVKI